MGGPLLYVAFCSFRSGLRSLSLARALSFSPLLLTQRCEFGKVRAVEERGGGGSESPVGTNPSLRKKLQFRYLEEDGGREGGVELGVCEAME